MLNPTRFRHCAIAAIAVSTVLTACSKSNQDTSKAATPQTAGGALDTASLPTTATPAAAGPAVQVTRTDSKSVSRATQFELTQDNFAKFMAAADSIVALEGRDPSMKQYLSQPLTDAGAKDADAGLRWLQASAAVTKAINSAGLPVQDYFVESIAIADAQRFMANPNTAPPTPALSKNAAFLRSHQADLERLQAEREGRPVVTVTP
jgi:hypothetical protein